jgi:uncharacterized damage-inducible protein DinB
LSVRVMSGLLGYEELFDYFKRARGRLIDALERLPSEQLTKSRGLSFESIKDVLVHTVMNEDTWLHCRLPGLGNSTTRRFEEFRSLEDIKNYIAEVDGKTNKLFAQITEDDLRRPVKRIARDGSEETFELEQVLYQLPIEAIYHFGEIFGEFWKMNLEAPYYPYLAYSREERER